MCMHTPLYTWRLYLYDGVIIFIIIVNHVIITVYNTGLPLYKLNTRGTHYYCYYLLCLLLLLLWFVIVAGVVIIVAGCGSCYYHCWSIIVVGVVIL